MIPKTRESLVREEDRLPMFSKEQLVQYVVDLIATNDHELIYQDNILPRKVCHPDDRSRIRSFSEDLETIYGSCWPDGYLRSSEFASRCHGKSAEYAAMLTKTCDAPVKRAEKHKDLDVALAEIMSSDRTLDLAPEELLALVPGIRSEIRRTRNPEQINGEGRS